MSLERLERTDREWALLKMLFDLLEGEMRFRGFEGLSQSGSIIRVTDENGEEFEVRVKARQAGNPNRENPHAHVRSQKRNDV